MHFLASLGFKTLFASGSSTQASFKSISLTDFLNTFPNLSSSLLPSLTFVNHKLPLPTIEEICAYSIQHHLNNLDSKCSIMKICFIYILFKIYLNNHRPSY